MRLAKLAMAAAVFVCSACSSAATATKNPRIVDAPTPTSPEEVVIYEYKYIPPTMTVAVGATVTWVNHDIAPHTATYRSFDAESFDSGNLSAMQIYSHRFKKAGTYDYLCTLHQGMRGTVVVQ